MNNRELDNLLRSAPVPERPPDFWENLPKQITKRLGEQERRDVMRSTNGAKRQARLMPVLWGVGLATACLALGFFWGLGRGRTISITEKQIAETKQYYEQVSGLFPNQLRAIIFENGKPQLVLSDKADVPNSPAILIKVQQPEGVRSFVTFSGQRIRLNGEECEVLVDTQGHVFLLGKNWLWSSAETGKQNEPYRIQAKALGSLM